MKKYLFVFSLFCGSLSTIFLVKRFSFSGDSPISKITQLSLQKEALSSLYLTELLDLSFDKKSYREGFDLQQAKKKLLASSLICDASVSFIDNKNILVKYQHVTPIARLGDFVNSGIDKEGNLFPLQPFFLKMDYQKSI